MNQLNKKYSNDHFFFLQKAYKKAQKAFSHNEIPVGAVIIHTETGTVIASAYNCVEKKRSQLFHAEVIALNKAAQALKSWRLHEYTLYVTLQPCVMCLGALYLFRIQRVIYGVKSHKFGTNVDFGGIYSNKIMNLEYCPHEESVLLLQKFFKKKRIKV